jgi:hypothetical protein
MRTEDRPAITGPEIIRAYLSQMSLCTWRVFEAFFNCALISQQFGSILNIEADLDGSAEVASLDIGSLGDNNSTGNDAWLQQLANAQPTTSESSPLHNLSGNNSTGNDANDRPFPLAVQPTTSESRPLLNIVTNKK